MCQADIQPNMGQYIDAIFNRHDIKHFKQVTNTALDDIMRLWFKLCG